jgi:hypothetical protein
MHKHRPDARQLAREKLLFRYSSALERGDFDTVADILRQAERDPILEQMIWEMHEALRAEQPTPSLHLNGKHTGAGVMTTTYRADTPRASQTRYSGYRWSWATLAAALIALVLFSGVLLALRRPTGEPDNLAAGQVFTMTPTPAPSATFTLTPSPMAQVITSTPLPVSGGVLCQVFNSLPDSVSVRMSPSPADASVGMLLPNASADVLELAKGTTDDFTWYRISFQLESATITGWVRQDTVSELTDCHEPGFPLGDAIASVVPTVVNPAGSQGALCQAFVNLSTGVDVLSRPSENAVVIGHIPLGTTVSILDQQWDTTTTPSTWLFVSGMVDGQMVQGWASARDLSFYGDTSCPIPAEIQAIQTTSDALGIQPISPEQALTLTALPTCPPEVSAFETTPTFTPTPAQQSSIDPIYLTATAVVMGVTQTMEAVQGGTAPPTPFSEEGLYLTATAAVAQATQYAEGMLLPPTVVPPAGYPCGSFTYWTPTPAATPTAAILFTQWNSVIVLEALDGIPANTPVRIRSAFFNGMEWIYEVETLDASTMSTARESQLGIVYRADATPTAGFDGALRSGGFNLMTIEPVGAIPANTRVQLGSAWYNSGEWMYQIQDEQGRAAEARESQLAYAPGYVPGMPTVPPTLPPPSLMPSRTPAPAFTLTSTPVQ